MKITAEAKFDIMLSNGASILKGDKFNVYGSVIAVKGDLIDLTEFEDAFVIKRIDEQPEPIMVEVIFDIMLDNGSIVPKGTKFPAYSDVIGVNGSFLNLITCKSAIKVSEPVIEPMQEPTVEPTPEPTEPEVSHDGNLSNSSVDSDGNIHAGTGISAKYASKVTDGLLEAYLIPMVQTIGSVGPSVGNVYTTNTPDETSLAFGVTRLTEQKWDITDEYDIKMSIGTSEENVTGFTFEGEKIIADNDPEYVITDSYVSEDKPTNTIQNATRIRFLTEAGLLVNSDNSRNIYAKIEATHKKTGKKMVVDVKFNNEYTEE